MREDRRKFMRFDIPLDIEFKPSIDAETHSTGTTVNFSRSGLCFEAKELDYNLMDMMVLKVKLPEKNNYISVTGDLAWKKKFDNFRCIVGIKFKEIDSEAKSHILDLAYEEWLLKFQR